MGKVCRSRLQLSQKGNHSGSTWNRVKRVCGPHFPCKYQLSSTELYLLQPGFKHLYCTKYQSARKRREKNIKCLSFANVAPYVPTNLNQTKPTQSKTNLTIQNRNPMKPSPPPRSLLPPVAVDTQKTHKPTRARHLPAPTLMMMKTMTTTRPAHQVA